MKGCERTEKDVRREEAVLEMVSVKYILRHVERIVGAFCTASPQSFNVIFPSATNKNPTPCYQAESLNQIEDALRPPERSHCHYRQLLPTCGSLRTVLELQATLQPRVTSFVSTHFLQEWTC
jgi:hypothetical protein